MCTPKPCSTCQKTTWSGCGRHVAEVRARVPADQWCDGTHAPAADPSVATPPGKPPWVWWRR